MPRFLALFAGLLALGACRKDADPEVRTPAPVAVGSALYRVTFEASWSASTHANFPVGHISRRSSDWRTGQMGWFSSPASWLAWALKTWLKSAITPRCKLR